MSYPKYGLTFEDLREANKRRLPQFKNRQGEPAHSEADGTDWSIQDWLAAANGELAEVDGALKAMARAQNKAKHIVRGDHDESELLDAVKALGHELADVVTYLDIAASRCGIDLGNAVRDKFNLVSERVGATTRL